MATLVGVGAGADASADFLCELSSTPWHTRANRAVGMLRSSGWSFGVLPPSLIEAFGDWGWGLQSQGRP